MPGWTRESAYPLCGGCGVRMTPQQPRWRLERLTGSPKHGASSLNHATLCEACGRMVERSLKALLAGKVTPVDA